MSNISSSTLFDLLESTNNQEKNLLIRTIEHEVGLAFKKMDIYTSEFSLEEVHRNSFIFVGYLEKMPKLYVRPILSVTFKCDDDLVKSGGDGYLSGYYQFQWCMRRWVEGRITPYKEEPGKVEDVLTESPYLQLHVEIKDYEVISVHINDVHYFVSENNADKLLIPSCDIKEWYDRYANFGPTLDDTKLPPFVAGGV